jgi:hypothetical protein
MGGVAPYGWSIVSGALPDGLQINNLTGVISGTPTRAGAFAFTVQASDTTSFSVSRVLSITINPPLTITTPLLPNGNTGVAYSLALTATGGNSPYSWSLQAGSSLPSGLSLNSSTGVISGTPTTSGGYSTTVQVTDANANTAAKSLSSACF